MKEPPLDRVEQAIVAALVRALVRELRADDKRPAARDRRADLDTPAVEAGTSEYIPQT